MMRDAGIELRELGKFDEAAAVFEALIRARPADGSAHRYLLEMQAPDDPRFSAHVRAIEALIEQGLHEDDSIELHFALGDAYDRAGDADRAYPHFRAGNALRRRRIDYDEERERLHLTLLQKTFGRTIAAHAAPRIDALPVFIIGMPRSGTTLAEAMLAPHPKIRALGELTAFERAFHQMRAVQARPHDVGGFAAELREALREVGERYLAEVTPPGDAVATVDKMPANFRFAVPIHATLPGAKLIHVRRDPLDTCFSCYATNFTESQTFAFEIGELARYYALYQRHMEVVRAILPAGVMLEIDYEEMVAEPEAAARRMLAHCGLEWDPAVREYRTFPRHVKTASVVQVRRPLYRTSIGRAKRYPEFCREFRQQCLTRPPGGSTIS